MDRFDSVFGMDWWEDTRYIGDGVYAKHHPGIYGSVMLRTDRGGQDHVIAIDSEMLDVLKAYITSRPRK